MSEAYKDARLIASVLLKKVTNPSEDSVRAVVSEAAGIVSGEPLSPDERDALVADLLHSFSVHEGGFSALDDPTEHIEWLPDKTASVDWKFWDRYEEFLHHCGEYPDSVIRELNRQTKEVLRRLEDPERDGKWDRRGMVVGSVQSGKTSNYIGLICKAIDAGYKVVVVLAGLHNNLRSQTQLRIDEGVLGYDSEKTRASGADPALTGVGLLPCAKKLHVLSLTSSAEDGDFRKRSANQITTTLGGLPTLIVVKKNGSVLKTLRKWLTDLAGDPIRDVPLLVVDDEADQASINTKVKRVQGPAAQDEESVSRINQRIRQLLATFHKSAYVGYTATPFANIFINPDAYGEKLADDIFPRSFILNIHPPSNYVGPARVLGLEGDPDAGIEPREPLPLFVPVEDSAAMFPPKHKKTLDPTALPESLERAICAFVLVCAARVARMQKESHNSMLIHVTRFVDVQGRVAHLVRDYLDLVRRRITYGDGSRTSTIREDLRTLWVEEFDSKYDVIREAEPHEVGRRLSWNEVDAALVEAVTKIEVKEINGSANDVLDYARRPNGVSVIAIGGDKLSRGLTLFGLSIAYFLRTSRMYDTLLQMGRWFGYRPGYLDLCRLWTTDDLRLWYRHIALAEEELRRDFDDMSKRGLTPENYGLRVRSHSGGLIVTALNKMCHSKNLRLTFAGELKQTAYFDVANEARLANLSVLKRFVAGSPKPKVHPSRNGKALAWFWDDLSPQHLKDLLLDGFQVHPNARTVNLDRIGDFMDSQVRRGELINWSVVLVNSSTHPRPREWIPGLMIGPSIRDGDERGWFETRNSNIQSPEHQCLDLRYIKLTEEVRAELLDKRLGERHLFDADERQLILEEPHSLYRLAVEISSHRAGKKVEVPHGKVARELRPKSRGLLLVYPIRSSSDHEKIEGSSNQTKKIDLEQKTVPYIGLAFSFPTSHTARSVAYQANTRLVQELEDDEFED